MSTHVTDGMHSKDGKIYEDNDQKKWFAAMCNADVNKGKSTFCTLHIDCLEGHHFCVMLSGNVGDAAAELIVIAVGGMLESMSYTECMKRKNEGALTDSQLNLHAAKTTFEALFHQWTNNYWEDVRRNPECFWQFKDFHTYVESRPGPPLIAPAVVHQLHELLHLDNMQQSMERIAESAFPLGKLSPRQIRLGMEALMRIQSALEGRTTTEFLKELIGAFYSIVPHDSSVLRSELIQDSNAEKLKLLEAMNDGQSLWGLIPSRHEVMATHFPSSCIVVDGNNGVWAATLNPSRTNKDPNRYTSLQLLHLKPGVFLCSQKEGTAAATGIFTQRKTKNMSTIKITVDNSSKEHDISKVERHHLTLAAAKETFRKLFRRHTNNDWDTVMKEPRVFVDYNRYMKLVC